MEEALEKTLRRVGEDAEYIISTSESAKDVLNSLVAELTPVVMAYKMQGVVPSIQSLSGAAAKLIAIVAATNKAAMDKAYATSMEKEK